MSVQDYFQSFSFEGQQDTKNLGFPTSAAFPLALQAVNNKNRTLQEWIDIIRSPATSQEILELVQKHGGALLLRGLPIKTPDDYSQIAHAFGFAAHEEVGRPPHRTLLAKNVKTANEGPPEMPIWLHNEYGWSTINPAWLTFSALELPEKGGETPITSSIGLAAAIKAQAPEFFETLLEKGIKYTYRYGSEDNKGSNTGTSVLSAYGHTVLASDDKLTSKRKIEDEIRRHSNRFTWHEDGSLSVDHIVPIIRIHEANGLPTWFGNLTSAYGRSKHHGATEPPFLGDDGSYHPLPTYGDGSAIPTAYLELALSLAEKAQVFVTWKAGDVVLLDNYAVMHSRSPWVGKRVVLAALWDQDDRISDYDQGKKILESSPRRPIQVIS